MSGKELNNVINALWTYKDIADWTRLEVQTIYKWACVSNIGNPMFDFSEARVSKRPARFDPEKFKEWYAKRPQ